MAENKIHGLTPIAFHRFFFSFYNLLTLLPNCTMQAPPGPHSREKQQKSQNDES